MGGGVTASSLSETSKYPLQTNVATREINQLKELIADVSEMKATLSSYGMTKLSTATDITDINAYALSATENNPSVSGSLRNSIEYLNKQVAISQVQWEFIHYTENNKVDAVESLDNPTKLFGKYVQPYVILFQDDVGDSPLGGGITCVFGYCYVDDLYGAQIKMNYNLSESNYARSRYGGNWTEWYPLRN